MNLTFETSNLLHRKHQVREIDSGRSENTLNTTFATFHKMNFEVGAKLS